MMLEGLPKKTRLPTANFDCRANSSCTRTTWKKAIAYSNHKQFVSGPRRPTFETDIRKHELVENFHASAQKNPRTNSGWSNGFPLQVALHRTQVLVLNQKATSTGMMSISALRVKRLVCQDTYTNHLAAFSIKLLAARRVHPQPPQINNLPSSAPLSTKMVRSQMIGCMNKGRRCDVVCWKPLRGWFSQENVQNQNTYQKH